MFSKTKHPRNLESKHDSNLIKCQFQSSNNDYNQINPQKTQLSSKTKNDISNEKPHITLIDLLKIYNEDQNFDTNEPEASIFEKFKQNSYLANVPIDIFFQFLEKTNLLNYSRIERLTIFEKYNENKEHEPLETIAETLLKESDFKLVVWFISLWAKSLQDILKITFLIINRNNENDFKMAMEIFLMIGHLNLKKKVQCLEIRNYSLFASFGCFLGKFFQALGMELEIYGKTMFYFSRFLPDLHFPIGISKSRCREYYEKLSDFILTFLAQLDFKNFVKFFCEIHQPPQDVNNNFKKF